MKIRLLPEAERDLEIAADFYESQRPGLGSYYNDCLAADIESLRIFAGIHETYLGFQRSLSKRFPFSIYYILADDCVHIYAVLDARQDPETIDTLLDSPRTKRSTEVAESGDLAVEYQLPRLGYRTRSATGSPEPEP